MVEQGKELSDTLEDLDRGWVLPKDLVESAELTD
jgi:hypothetical protein